MQDGFLSELLGRALRPTNRSRLEHVRQASAHILRAWFYFLLSCSWMIGLVRGWDGCAPEGVLLLLLVFFFFFVVLHTLTDFIYFSF